MGFRVLLAVVTSKAPDEAHRTFGVRATNRFEEIPESDVTGAALPTGDYLLYVNREAEGDDDALQRLSAGGRVIACRVDESMTMSSVHCWTDGAPAWEVVRLPDDMGEDLGLGAFEMTGAVPPELAPIQAAAEAKQHAETDDIDHLFDVPVALFLAHGGFRYDTAVDDAEWEVLERTDGRT